MRLEEYGDPGCKKRTDKDVPGGGRVAIFSGVVFLSLLLTNDWRFNLGTALESTGERAAAAAAAAA